MMRVQAVQIHREGGENDTNAQVVVQICDDGGDWHEVGREQVNSNFSHIWELPAALDARAVDERKV